MSKRKINYEWKLTIPTYGFIDELVYNEIDEDARQLISDSGVNLPDSAIDFIVNRVDETADNKAIFTEIAKRVQEAVLDEFKGYGFITDYKIDKNLYQPQFYNYSNDSVCPTVTVTKANIENLIKYLGAELDEIRETWRSFDGFMSFVDIDPELWTVDAIWEGLCADPDKYLILSAIFERIAYNFTPTGTNLVNDAVFENYRECVHNNTAATATVEKWVNLAKKIQNNEHVDTGDIIGEYLTKTGRLKKSVDVKRAQATLNDYNKFCDCFLDVAA